MSGDVGPRARTRSRCGRRTPRATSTRRPRRGRSRSTPPGRRSSACSGPAEPHQRHNADVHLRRRRARLDLRVQARGPRGPGRRTSPAPRRTLTRRWSRTRATRSASAPATRPGTSAPPATWSFTLFTTAPETGISSGPKGSTRNRDPEFVLASSPPGATFTCTLNGTPIVPCATPLALHALADGAYSLSVAATDDVGNVDPTPVVRAFTVDTTAPETYLDATPPATVHSGPLAFSVRADDGTVACALDDGEYGSCAPIVRAETARARRARLPRPRRGHGGQHRRHPGRVPLHGRQRRPEWRRSRSTPSPGRCR